MKKYDTRMINTLGALIAIEIVLSRFLSITAWNTKIGFSFIPIAVAAILFGAAPAGIVAAVADFMGAILFPVGAYFPGFTLTAFLTGIVFGLCFGKRQTPGRILAAVAVNQLILGLLVNTLWISVLYSSPFLPLMMTRSLQCAVLLPVQFLVICSLSNVMCRYGKKVLA